MKKPNITLKNYITIEDYECFFMNYGKIIVPKGTRVHNLTAMGLDDNYNFVCEYEWIKEKYLKVANILRMDISNYGINVPKEILKRIS